ncbi:MAG: hypothetical protein ACT4PG_04275 [Panacagrimonas sp.]
MKFILVTALVLTASACAQKPATNADASAASSTPVATPAEPTPTEHSVAAEVPVPAAEPAPPEPDAPSAETTLAGSQSVTIITEASAPATQDASSINEASAPTSEELDIPEAPAVLPAKGLDMAAVEKAFGTPRVKNPTVGGSSRQQPPITRWDYPGFSVIFEHDHVVDAVRRNNPAPIQVFDGLAGAPTQTP